MRVLVALDYSPCSRLACEWAVARHRPSELLFHHVIRDRDVGDIERAVGELRVFVQELAGGELEGARYTVAAGQPGEEIVRTAEVHGVEAIVMGTNGRQGLDRLLVGSVAEAVVRAAPCTVVVVKPGPTTKETA